MTKINVSNIDIKWEPEKGTCTFEKLPVAMINKGAKFIIRLFKKS